MARPQNYHTKQGRALLSFLQEHPGEHFDRRGICEALSARGISLGESTVWRYLERMFQKGEIRKSSPDGKSTCYTYGCCDKTHYHLHCTGCDRVIHLDCEQLDRLRLHVLSEHGFEVDSLHTTLQGLCRECRQKEEQIEWS